jgi:hypothetical protein
VTPLLLMCVCVCSNRKRRRLHSKVAPSYIPEAQPDAAAEQVPDEHPPSPVKSGSVGSVFALNPDTDIDTDIDTDNGIVVIGVSSQETQKASQGRHSTSQKTSQAATAQSNKEWRQGRCSLELNCQQRSDCVTQCVKQHVDNEYNSGV